MGFLGEDTNAVFSDDFETPSLQSPPSGWAMWGAEEFKVPANYTRDTTQLHGGQACFRIHHPANTGGRGFILGSGCEVPVEAPRENIKALIRAARVTVTLTIQPE